MTKILVSEDEDAINFYGGNLEAFKSKDSFVVLVGPANSGKAEFVDNKIPTPKGWVKIKDTNIGDFIFNEQGEVTQITGKYPQGKKVTNRVKFEDATYLDVCEDHLWEVEYEDKIEVVTTKFIKENLEKEFYIPLSKPVHYNNNFNHKISPYLFGYLIENSKYIENNLYITKPIFNTSIINKIRNKLPEDYQLKKVITKDYEYRILKNSFLNVIGKTLDLNYKKHKYGYIPNEYLLSPIDERLELLYGLMDSKGIIKNNYCLYYTYSKQIANSVSELIQSLGGMVRIRHKIFNKKREYCLIILLPQGVLPSDNKELIKNYNEPEKELKKKIVDVKEMTEQEMICISVDNPRSLYLTKNYIVTHNTFTMCMKMHLFALKYPGARILMTRKSLTSLRNSAVITYQNILRMVGMDDEIRTLGETRPTNFIYPYKERTENGITYKGKSEIILAPLDTRGKALGAEYNMVYVNQPDTEGTTLEEFQLIRSRCRLTNTPYKQLICDPNPAHDKHWLLLRSKNIDPNTGLWNITESYAKDNPSLFNHKTNEWTENGLEFLESLSGLTGNLKSSQLEGKWYSLSGMAFSDYWQPHRHVLMLETEEAQELGVSQDIGGMHFVNSVPQDWHHYLTIDWGFGDPFVAILIAKHPKKDLYIAHKHIYITKKDINYVADLTHSMISGYNIKSIIADRGRAESHVMETVLGRSITTATKGAGSVIDSMNLVISELNSDRWKFVNLEDSLFHPPDPELVSKYLPMGYDEFPNLKKDDKTGKIADGQADHYYDAFKYFVRFLVEKNKGNIGNNKFVWL